jgi:hypothetical protein
MNQVAVINAGGYKVDEELNALQCHQKNTTDNALQAFYSLFFIILDKSLELPQIRAKHLN